VIYDGKSDGAGAGSAMASKKNQAEQQEAARIRSEIEAMITRSVGPGKAIVSAQVEMNFDREDVSTVTETPSNKPVSSERVSETYNNAGGAAPGGIASTGSPAAPATGLGASGPGYQSTHEVSNFPTEKVSSVKSVASSRAQIEQFVTNYIGADTDPENFKVAVSTVPFDTSFAEEAKKTMTEQKSGQMMQQIISLIPVLAMVVVGFLVMRALAKAAVSNRTMVLTAGALGGGGTASLSAGRPAAQVAELRPLPPQDNSVESLGGAARARAEMIKRSLQEEVEDIPEKFDVSLVQILRMSEQRPEAVAMLIKSWLLEETR
jgi:flagellar biosynthesis/type III secretory pathway M-ring protein FliF/YscJ